MCVWMSFSCWRVSEACWHKPFLWDSCRGRTRGFSDPGNIVASLCCNPEKLFFSPKFDREARLWPLSYELLPHLVVWKQADAFKNLLEWHLRDPNLSRPLSSWWARMFLILSLTPSNTVSFLTKQGLPLHWRSLTEPLFWKLGESLKL